MEYILRNYKNVDYDFVYQLKKQAYKKYVIEYWGEWNEENQQEFFDEYIKNQAPFIKIIVFNNKDIGFFDANIKEGVYEINNICIGEEYRGNGLGTQILKDAIEKHKNCDIKLQFFKSNRVGNLYKRLGFKIIGETKTHFQMLKKR